LSRLARYKLKFLLLALTTLLVDGTLARVCGGEVNLPNGISARVHTPAEIEANWLDRSDGKLILHHPAIGSLELLVGPEDPRLLRNELEGFFPFDNDVVTTALGDMHGMNPRLAVEIFILPSPPVQLQSSFARENFIFLAPGYGPIPACSAAYTVTHEMGHVLTWAYLDNAPGRWNSYLELRRLDPLSFGTDIPHASRIREILAEDIRYLFGGRLATTSGTIENHELPLPDQVFGLKEMLAEFFQGEPLLRGDYPSRAFPNPCNPVTTIQMRIPVGVILPANDHVVLAVYDVRGRCVKRITTGQSEGEMVSIQWDGRNASGQNVPSGRYCYIVRVGSVVSRGSIQLVR